MILVEPTVEEREWGGGSGGEGRKGREKKVNMERGDWGCVKGAR